MFQILHGGERAQVALLIRVNLKVKWTHIQEVVGKENLAKVLNAFYVFYLYK